MEPYEELLLRVKVELGVMAMKGYSVIPKSLEPRHQIQFSLIPRPLLLVDLTPRQGILSAYSKPHRQGDQKL